MFRFSLVTVFLVLFMTLASIAAPVPAPLADAAAIQTPDRSDADLSLETRDLETIETRDIEKRRNGRATWFNTGLGNCGKVSKDSQLIVALATKTYAKGKFCGKKVTIKNTKNGKSTTATVMDSCPSCGPNDLDLSPAAFKKLGSLSTGVLSVSWNFS
ncbi:hypothetical protein RhiJN_27868 [Ceratobasidium sp. AG-Ba]|nr:hypothetical protein RhiJN_27868 [Ceratobasidium sp. AG-Ba]